MMNKILPIILVVVLSGCSQLKTLPMVNAENPYEINNPNQVKSIALNKVVSEIRREAKIGNLHIGAGCEGTYELNWKTGELLYYDFNGLDEIFRDELEASGWIVVGKEGNLFEGQDNDGAEIQVAAVITDIKAELCSWRTMFTTLLGVKGDLVIYVEWQIYDPIKKEILGKFESEGSARVESFKQRGELILWEDAFAIATNNLLANINFVRLVKKSINHE